MPMEQAAIMAMSGNAVPIAKVPGYQGGMMFQQGGGKGSGQQGQMNGWGGSNGFGGPGQGGKGEG